MNSFRKKGSPEFSVGAIALTAVLAITTVPAYSEPRPAPTSNGLFAQEPVKGPISTETTTAGEAPSAEQFAAEKISLPDPNPDKEKLTSFFLIGVVINLLLLFAAGIWAYREWRRRN